MTACILLFDKGAILTGNANLWREVSRLGECILPQAIADEIVQVANGRSDDGSSEATAKEFQRLLTQLGWQTTTLSKHCEALAPAPGQSLSHRARLALNVAQAAYGVADHTPTTPIVLVTDDAQLRDRINTLGILNLGAITAAMARQWARTNQPPEPVATVLARIPASQGKPTAASSSRSPAKTTHTPSSSKPRSVRPPKNKINYKGLVGSSLSAVFAIIMLLYGWRYIQPQQFQQFWQKTGLPALPKLPFESAPPKP
jgi:hypothetical protein